MAIEATELHQPFYLEINGDPGGGDSAEFVIEDMLAQMPLLSPSLFVFVRTGSGDVDVEISRTDDFGIHAEPLHSGIYTHVIGNWLIAADSFASLIGVLPTLARGNAGVQTVRHTVKVTNQDIAVTATIDVIVQGDVEVSGNLQPNAIPGTQP